MSAAFRYTHPIDINDVRLPIIGHVLRIINSRSPESSESLLTPGDYYSLVSDHIHNVGNFIRKVSQMDMLRHGWV